MRESRRVIPDFRQKFKHYVHVIATPNEEAKKPAKGEAEFVVRDDLSELKGTEVPVFLMRTDIAKVCPMVAYSGCAARVLAQVHFIPLD